MANVCYASLSVHCSNLRFTPKPKNGVTVPPAATTSLLSPSECLRVHKKLLALPFRLMAPGQQRLLPWLGSAAMSAYRDLLNACIDRLYHFSDQPWQPSQSNFAPVHEIGDALPVVRIEGKIPEDFLEGVYIRNGSNPIYGTLQATSSVFGRSSESWVEGEGMLHAVYFSKDADGNWKVSYKNKYVETDTFSVEKARRRPTFLPQIEGEPVAVLAGLAFNMLRYGKITKLFANNGVIEHAGKVYATADSHAPQEVDISSLETYGSWTVGGSWKRPITTHAKKIPKTGELVVIGVRPQKPYVVVGVVSANGNELVHEVDLKFKRCTFCHDIGVTEKYNIILDFPFSADVIRLIKGGPLLKYEKKGKGFSRIGIVPRYGDASSIKWFEVDAYCAFHIVNCHEDNDEVVVRGIRSEDSIVPGPEFGRDKYGWFSRGLQHRENAMFFTRLYEWRLNMVTGGVEEKFLTGADFSVEFPFINERFNGLPNQYAYAQVFDCKSSSSSGMTKFGAFAKLHVLEEKTITTKSGSGFDAYIKAELHRLEQNHFCSGASFVPRQSNSVEDDGWIISFVHDEETNTSQVHIIDCQNFESSAIAKITLPSRVPYGFHGTFIPNTSFPLTENAIK